MNKTTTFNSPEAKAEEKSILPGEVIIGELADVDDLGRPLVTYSGNGDSAPILAVTTQAVAKSQIGRQVALLFANGESDKPVIVGLIHNPLSDMLENFSAQQAEIDTPFPEVSKEYENLVDFQRDKEEQVIVDGKHVTIEGAEELTLKCGKASITLTKSGKILIRGTYLSNRSSGVNRILGGSVQIN